MNSGMSKAAPPRLSLTFAAPMLIVLAAAGSAFAVVAQDTETTLPPAATAEVDLEQAGKIAVALRTDLSKLASTASAEDMEASMLFVLSQAEYPLETMEAALDIVEAGPGTTPVLKEAIKNVRLALRRRFRRGTAAIGEGIGQAGDGVLFPPVISIQAGSADYGT